MKMEELVQLKRDVKIVPSPTLCRGCLTPDRDTLSLSYGTYKQLFEELTNISLADNAAWPRLCWECMSLLHKCLQFRRKLIQSHKLLQQYANFQVTQHGFTADLSIFASPLLSKSNTFSLSYADTEEHNTGVHNDKSSYEQYANDFNWKKYEVMESDDDRDHDIEFEALPVKVETDCQDLDDIIKKEALNEDTAYCIGKDMFVKRKKRTRNRSKVDEDYKNETEIEDIKEIDKRLMKKNTRKSTKRAKIKKKSRTKDLDKPKSGRGRIIVNLDPSKIRTINFTEAEQFEHMEIKRTDPSFLKFPFKCQLCCNGFNYNEKLLEHVKDKHEDHSAGRKTYKCNICHFYLRTYHIWKSHMYRHATVYECTVCGLRGYKKTPMIEHYGFTHEGNLDPYVCNVCGKCYAKKTLYLTHIRNHANEEQVQCDHCKRVYSRKDKLIVHMRHHYEDPKTKPFICHCGHRTRTAKQLEAHAVKHTTERPHYCVECDRSFKCRNSLRIHLRSYKTHADPKQFKFNCSECTRRFPLRTDLERHIDRVHLGIKRHACGLCDKRFYCQVTLTRHIRFIHEGIKQEKNYGCEVCGKMFSTKQLLTKHSRIHTGERPYSCPQCPATFNQTSSRTTHIRLVHLKMKRPFNRVPRSKMEDEKSTVEKAETNSVDGLQYQIVQLTTFPTESHQVFQ